MRKVRCFITYYTSADDIEYGHFEIEKNLWEITVSI